jgi:hypothetical protein
MEKQNNTKHQQPEPEIEKTTMDVLPKAQAAVLNKQKKMKSYERTYINNRWESSPSSYTLS